MTDTAPAGTSPPPLHQGQTPPGFSPFSPPPLTERTLRWVLTLALVFSFAWILVPMPLTDVDEGAFSEATREMLQSGDFITTRLNGELRFDKPILTYWAQAASGRVFGLNEFAMRLPSVIAAVAWMLALVRFGTRWASERRGLLAGIFLACSLQVTLIGKAAIADALLNAFLAAAMFAGYRHSRTGERRTLLLCFAFCALGFLTKGPVALLIPVAVSFLLYLTRRDLGGFFRAVLDPLGIAVFLVIAAPWYLAEYLAQGQAFIDGFFLEHNVSRFGTSFEGHGGSLLFYIPVVLLGTLPYSGVLIAALPKVKAWFRDDLDRFCLLWFAFVFLFFSFSGTKLHHYVVYGYTPLFLLLAKHVNQLRNKHWITVPAGLLFALMIALPPIAVGIRPMIDDAFAQDVTSHVPEAFGSGYFGVLTICAVALLALAAQRRFSCSVHACAAGLLCMLAVNGAVLPAYGKLAQQPVKEAGLTMRGGAEIPLKMWQTDNPSLLFYARRITPSKSPKPGDFVFLKTIHLDRLPNASPVYQKHGYTLAQMPIE